MDRKGIATRTIVRASIMAALYYVFVVGLAPLSYDIIQIRFANVLKALAIFDPAFAFGYGLGNFFANQLSPFGVLDWAVMPIFDVVAALVAYQLRKWKWFAVICQSVLIALGVATFPLGLGANLPWGVSFVSVFLSSLLVIGAGTLVLVPIYKSTGVASNDSPEGDTAQE